MKLVFKSRFNYFDLFVFGMSCYAWSDKMYITAMLIAFVGGIISALVEQSIKE